MITAKCPKAIIWGTGYTYNTSINAIRYQQLQNNIEIVGVTGREVCFSSIDDYQGIQIEELKEYSFEYIIVCGKEYFAEICKDIMKLGYDRNMVIDVRVFCIPNFNFRDYVEVIQSDISIMANNCWGGAVYHLLGMQFRTPLINMFERDDDYIRLCSDLHSYLQEEIKFNDWGYSKILKREYPVYRLKDIMLYFNHYTSKEEVEEKWYRRLKRMNWDNLFIMMYTESERIAEEFDLLEFEKKICFVPFESKLQSAYTLKNYSKNKTFGEFVNGVPTNTYTSYNVIDLLRGEVHKRIKF